MLSKESIKKIINRGDKTEDWTFLEFLKNYWWIEFLAIGKVIYFVNKGYYGYNFAILFLVGTIFVLWILYRIGLE